MKRMKIVLSASRRTDIPAFYMDWFMDRIEKGYFNVRNPFNQSLSVVPATPEAVHTIVFWSKDFRRFIKGQYGEKLIEKGFHLFFNFTINTENQILEPNILPLSDRLEQATALCRRFGAEILQWRFDPICFYRTGPDRVFHNIDSVGTIAEMLSALGIHRCITSFVDLYPKLAKRSAHLADFAFIDPPVDEKAKILLDIKRRLDPYEMRLYTCCEKEVMAALPEGTGIESSACIDNRHLVRQFGGTLSFKKDAGQRTAKGCGCMESKDIGDYRRHPCYHNCLFCYANPAPGPKPEGFIAK